jgi:glutamyl-tRNA synthetase
MTVKTRFAPSPTGYLHIGGVRTALFCWLYARHHGGEFVLRIEDTDRERSTQESIDVIMDGMAWVGLDWDEGPHLQSERFDRYHEVIDQMLAAGTAYHCYCTPEELEAMRAEQITAGENPRYDGRCRDRHEPREGIEPVVRFKTPREGEVIVNDLVHGRVVFSNSELDDLVILRSDGWPTYHFSVIIDDADMGITHVIRGDDHLNNTPRQINMIEALGLPLPQYAHLPMILGEDGARLSKRHGAVNVLEYRDRGYLPEAVLNYLVRLGWSHGDQEIFNIAQMTDLFDIKDVNAAASRFNPEKLTWLNQQYIQSAAARQLAPLLEVHLSGQGLDPGQGPALDAVVEAYKERAETMEVMAQSIWYLYRDFEQADEKAAKKHLRPVIKPALADLRQRLEALEPWGRESIHAAIEAVAEQHGLKFGKLGQPLRVAVTGGSVSPPIDVTTELVGRKRSLARIDLALVYIAAREAA